MDGNQIMEVLVPITKKFLAKYQRYEPKVRDNTSIITAKTCLRKYCLQIVLGFRPKQTAPYCAFGSSYHKFREVLEKTSSMKEGLKAAGDYWQKNGTEPTVGTKYDFMTGKRLLASCMVAFEHWEKERASTQIKVLASEQFFQVTLSDGVTCIGGRADQILRWNGKIWGRDVKTSSKIGPFY